MKTNKTCKTPGGAKPSLEKFLIGAAAALSLAFALFYSFGEPSASAAPAVETPVAITPTVVDSAASPEVAASVSDIVTKALAFKASLTTAQQATLQQTYSTSLARKWSNLPCGATCRNGIQFSALTSAQLALALQVIQAASGTTANEGYAEFLQLRAAEEALQALGANGYDENNYWISFLNTPSTTGGWMLQYGGHHYGANIAFNQGHFVGVTPIMEGVEPTSFTSNSVTYAPMDQERSALQTMFASLTTAQLTTAKLSSTFTDLTLSPGETNGGSGVFPTTKVGLPVSSLTSAQQLLVLEAIKPWVKDFDDTTATNLLAIYQNELSGTYIAFTGSGTSGTPSSFLNANTNYARIDGPSVWIEFICQNGIVIPNQIHYHTLYRDHTRDYGGDLALTTPLDTPAASVDSPADFDNDGKTDISVFRPSTGEWWINKSSTSATSAVTFGVSTDKIAPADFSGDGLTDIAIFRPSTGTWYVLRSSDSSFYAVPFGASGDTAVPGDYDGDGVDDLAVYRPSTFTWYVNKSSGGYSIVSFGASGDLPATGDYDGDGKTDVAVFRPSTGEWWIQRSSTAGVSVTTFGGSADKLVQGDYTGDGKTDIAIWRPSTGVWYVLRSEDGSYYSVPYGATGDTPAPGDYDGDGKFDTAIYRPSTATWYVNRSTAGSLITTFGTSTDTAVPAAFVQ